MFADRSRPRLAVLVAAMTLLAACGGGDGDDPAGEAVPGAVPAESASKVVCEGEPQEGGTLQELVPSYLDNLDVQKQSSTNTQNVAGPVYSRLLAYGVGEDITYGEDFVLEGDLAESWDVSDDGLTYTFELRDDVVWQDVPPVNGRPFVASDVVASMERVMEEGFAGYMLENVDEVVAVDDDTVEFRLSEPFAPLLNYLASHYMWILPREATIPVAEGGFDPVSTAIGTGPFMITGRTPNVEVVYTANPDYYGEGPHIDGFRRVIVPDEGGRINAFRAGEADIISGMSPEIAEQLTATTPDSELLTLLSPTHLVVFVNQDKAPMDELAFRKAISLAIDREGLGEAIYDGGALSGPVVGSLGEWALPQDELAELYPYDPEAARELLEEAGLTDATIGVVVTPGYGEQVTRAAQWIVEDLAEVGITGQVELVEYATYFGSRWPQQQYDIIVGLQTPFTEADEWLRAQHATGASRNWFGIDDPVLDEMLQNQLTLTDEEARVEAIHDIQRYIAENVMNPIPVWDYNTNILVGARVCDYFPDPLYGYYEYKDIWLRQ